MNDLINLDVTSAYSFLWGTFSPEELVGEVKALGMKGVALTDKWSLYGAIRFLRAARRENITPIIGARIRIKNLGWTIALSRNLRGYGNLCRLITYGIYKNQRHPRDIPYSFLREHSEGLVLIVGIYGSRLRRLSKMGDTEGAGILLLSIKRLLQENFPLFIGISFHEKKDTLSNEILSFYGKRLGLPTVFINHCAFLKRKDYCLHRLFVNIQKRHHHKNVNPLPNDSFFLNSPRDLSRYNMEKEAIKNTELILDLCKDFSFPSKRLNPPRFRPKKDAERELSKRCLLALSRRFKRIPPDYILTLDKELSIIRSRSLSDLFLLVGDICQRARCKGIRHSVRGSAAGSLVVHLLLKGPDPLRHNLLFERFINDGRNDLPDIDIDFDSERRDEITSWLMDSFSKDPFSSKAALVATVHTFRPRSAVRLSAKALGISASDIDMLVGALPWSLRGISLKEAVERLPELKDSPLRMAGGLLEMASRVEKLPFQTSVHLGGVVLAPKNILDWSPIFLSRKGFPVTQLDKDDIDFLGLLKIDLLGLRMHTAIKKALDVLKKMNKEIDIENLPLHDKKTFELLRTGNTLGIFQVESSGQRNLICRLRPGSFEDIVAEISLFRPGPVKGDMVRRFLENRKNKKIKEDIHPSIAPILKETHGVIVFQEQVLRIARHFAGLSYSEADAFRRAMTKDRKRHEMEGLKDAFIKRAVKMGRKRSEAERVFRKVSAFAAYGFCKAHAVSFAHITWQSAWLKAHYPLAFYIGLLNAGHVGSYPPYVILGEAKRSGIPVYPPCVNRSGLEYTREGKGIRCPLTVVKNIGRKRAKRIIEERKRQGEFLCVDDFLSRIDLPHEALRSLFMAGALSFENEEKKIA